MLRALGQRLARRRLEANLTQSQVAERAGVGRRAVQRLESGDPVTTVALVRILRALDALDDLDGVLPEPGPSPLAALERERGRRQRASGDRRTPERPPRPSAGDFRWGDER